MPSLLERLVDILGLGVTNVQGQVHGTLSCAGFS